MNDKYFILSRECKVVDGARRSLICDYGRQEVYNIPLSYSNLLLKMEREKIGTIVRGLDSESKGQFDEFLHFLLDKEIGFLTEYPQLFPKLNEEWRDPPHVIENAIIDIDTSLSHAVTAIHQLGHLNCQALQIRVFGTVSITELRSLLEQVNKACIGYVELHICESDHINDEDYEHLILNIPPLSFIFIYNQPEPQCKVIERIREGHHPLIFGHVYYLTQEVISEKCCGLISLDNITIGLKDLQTYYELKKYNGCLNKKISIDKTGKIKNCPSLPKDYGNISEQSLLNALEHPDFKKAWKINKDSISICKDCEYRYLCTDCRAYLQDPHDEHAKPLKCGYDPYTGEWADWKIQKSNLKALHHYGFTETLKSF